MRFSILVPVYNTQSFLPASVASALHQSEQDFELILVDDGSTDQSGALCDAYAARHPEQIRVIHQQNGGLIMARRAGIAAARGAYCIFLDADDALEPDCLKTVRETIEETGADIVIYNNYSYFEDDKTREPNAPVFADGSVFRGAEKTRVYRELISSWRLNNIWTKAIQTRLLTEDDTDFSRFAKNPHGEDLLQTLYPVTHASCIAYRTKELYLYRRHSRSMTRKTELSQISRLYNAAVLDQLRRYMTIWGMDRQADLNRFYTRKINLLLSLFWQHYRGAQNAAQKRTVLSYDWGALLDDESRRFLSRKHLSVQRRVQMNAILRRQKTLVDLFAVVGNLKMRAAHEA